MDTIWSSVDVPDHAIAKIQPPTPNMSARSGEILPKSLLSSSRIPRESLLRNRSRITVGRVGEFPVTVDSVEYLLSYQQLLMFFPNSGVCCAGNKDTLFDTNNHDERGPGLLKEL